MEIVLQTQDYTALGFEVTVDSSYCPLKYLDVRSKSAGYLTRNSLVRGC